MGILYEMKVALFTKKLSKITSEVDAYAETFRIIPDFLKAQMNAVTEWKNIEPRFASRFERAKELAQLKGMGCMTKDEEEELKHIKTMASGVRKLITRVALVGAKVGDETAEFNKAFNDFNDVLNMFASDIAKIESGDSKELSRIHKLVVHGAKNLKSKYKIVKKNMISTNSIIEKECNLTKSEIDCLMEVFKTDADVEKFYNFINLLDAANDQTRELIKVMK